MKKLITIITLTLTLLIPINVFSENKKIVDNVNILSDDELSSLTTQLDNLANKYDMDVVVYLSNDTSFGEDITSEGCEFYDLNGYGYGDNHRGVLLIINYEIGMFDIITTGDEVRNKYDGYIESCFDAMMDSVANNPYETIKIFEDWIDTRFISDEQIIDVIPVKKDNTVRDLSVSGITAAIVSVIVAIILKRQLITEGKKHGASNYIDKNSFNLTRSGDIFLYRTTSTRRIQTQQNNNNHSSGGGYHVSHTSSTGTSHGSGGGRHF